MTTLSVSGALCRQHGAGCCRVWRKLHLVADSATHEIICADLSLSGTTDAQALPGLINQTHRKIREASANGTYDSRYCHDVLLRKKNQAAYPATKGGNTGQTSTMNVIIQWQISILAAAMVYGKRKKVGYHRRSVAETAISRIKKVFGGRLSLRDYDA
ncbi:MAG: transposase [Symbiopectobacterium sp.]